MATAHLPSAIEIFRPGRHIDDQGVAREFTAADLKAIAAGYDPALHEAPLTVGHPAHDRPAYGWVGAVQVMPDGRLAITPRDVEPQFAEMVAARRFPKRSAAFYPPTHPKNPTPGRWYLRHVGFLGAQPPAIAGLRDVQFADDAAGTVSFSEAGGDSGHNPHQEHHTMTDEEKAALARAEKAEADARAEAEARTRAEAEAKAAKEALAQFAEQQRAARHASHVAFCEGLAAAEGEHAGKLLPKDVQIAAAALDVLADAQPVEFAEGDTTRKVSPAEWLRAHLTSRSPVVQFGEFAPGQAGTQRLAPPKDDAELDARAKAYARDNKVSYAEALSAVVSITA